MKKTTEPKGRIKFVPLGRPPTDEDIIRSITGMSRQAFIDAVLRGDFETPDASSDVLPAEKEKLAGASRENGSIEKRSEK